MYEIPSRCPCCQARLTALVSVEDLGGDPERGHNYEIGLNLASFGASPLLRRLEHLTPGGSEFVDNPENCLNFIERRLRNLHKLLVRVKAGPESCVPCENPFTTAGERLECEAARRRTS